MAIKIKKDTPVSNDSGLGDGGVPNVAPENLNSQAAKTYNEYLKGKATQGLLSAADKKWTDNYNKNRYEILKGKATQGIKLTEAEQAESDFLIDQGIEGFGNPGIVQGGVGGNGGAEALAAAEAARKAAEEKRLAGKSAYDILFLEFKKYGLESLVTPLKGFIEDGFSEAEFTLKLRETDAYKKRFAANAKRISNGFAAIDEATYLGLEDRYQSIMQNYGMPAKYYARGELGVQQYFEDAISNNVDPVTFEERIMEGKKVIDANKTTLDAIKQFYPSLNDGDFLSYVLDSKNAISDIQRKVTSAEIGGAQIGAGLGATFAGAEALAKAGVTGQGYQKAAATIAEDTMRGGQLAAIYKQDPYTQQTAEANILNLPGSAAAKKQTQKLEQLETAAFSGRSGTGAIARDRAGTY
jgi:hypothetical protein